MKQITECYRCFVKLFVCYRVTTAAQIQCLEQVFFFCVVLFAWPSVVNFQVLLCMTLSCSLNLSSMITSSLVFSNIAYCFSFLFVRTIQQYEIFYIQFSGMNFRIHSYSVQVDMRSALVEYNSFSSYAFQEVQTDSNQSSCYSFLNSCIDAKYVCQRQIQISS